MLPSSKTESNSTPEPLSPGDILQDRYRVVRTLGKGGMGAVYEALDQRLDATVALKETFSVDVRLRKQFELEARLLAQLNHPALPRVSDYFTEGNRAFLVMQFISGVDLAEIIAKQPGPFPRNQVVAWADQLLDALIYLHTRDRQIIHRDIKPHNLKLSSTGKIALLDFGLAKAQSADRTAEDTSNSIFGYTRRYAPLEQIQDHGTSPQSDIYALGATLYHLLTGVKPADALIRAAAAGGSMPDPLRPANEIHPAVGPELAAILCRAMAQNADDRYTSATAFREALWQLGRSEDAETGDTAHDRDGQTLTVVSAPAKSSEGRVQAISSRTKDPFEGYSILKPEEIPLFMPRPAGNSNATVSAVLFLFLLGLLGALYGYRHLSEAPGVSKSIKATTGQRAMEPAQQNKSDKQHLNPSLPGANIAGSTEAGRQFSDVERKSIDRKSFVVDSASVRDETFASPIPRQRERETSTRLSIPEARLPKADLKTNDPAPAVHGLPTFAQQPESVVERQVLRTSDGTQVVKFSDGTTRVFRPGEKNTPGISPE